MAVNNILSTYTFLNTNCNANNKNLSVIRSNLMHKCLLMAEEENSTLDIRSICCRWCLNPLSPQHCGVTLKPEKRPKNHLRSLLKKDTKSLNIFQKKLVEKIRSKPLSNTMIFKCYFCTRTTSVSLKKPIAESAIESDEVIVAEDLGRKKKKKKKKDIYAGLNVAAVQSVKNIPVNVNTKKLDSVKISSKKYAKKLSIKEQSRMQKVLLQAPVPKKKPTLLAAFLDNM